MTDDDRMFRITTDRDDLLFVRGLDEANEAAENLICGRDVLWVHTEPCSDGAVFCRRDGSGALDRYLEPPDPPDYDESADATVQIAPDGRPFVWGDINAIHEVGDFAIVEATQTRPISNSDAPNGGVGRVTFHAYVAGRNTSHAHRSLDEALAWCLAYKYDEAGPNTRAHTYFMRGIGARP